MNKFKNLNAAQGLIISIIVIAYNFLKSTTLKVLVRLLFKKAIQRGDYNKVIILKSGGLGDFLMGVPALNLIKRTYSGADIVLLTNKTFGGFSLKDLWLTEPVVVESAQNDLGWLSLVENKVTRSLQLRSISRVEIARLRAEVGELKNTAVVVLCYPGVPFLSLLKRLFFVRLLTGGNVSVFGFDKRADYSVFRRHQTMLGLFKHKALGDLDSAAELCGSARYEDQETFDLYVTASSRQKISEVVRPFDEKKKLIVVAPIAVRAHKQWPISSYRKLITQLTSQLQGKVCFLLVGTLDDRLAAEELVLSGPSGAQNLCGKLSLSEIAALLDASDGFLGNDGGMAHLAGALGVPSVVIFNSVEEHGLTTPLSAKSAIVRFNVDCSPCYNEFECPLGHRACVVGIAVESVIAQCIRCFEL